LLERAGHRPEAVAAFLMRALFTMFAADVALLPKDSFLELLRSRRARLETFVPKVEELRERTNTGGFSNALDHHVRRLNSNLFAEARALPLDADQLELLAKAGASGQPKQGVKPVSGRSGWSTSRTGATTHSKL
jgi:hypothetical protein